MTHTGFDHLFTEEALKEIFPRERSDDFFETLFGDAGEGAYDIHLVYNGQTGRTLQFEFQLKQRPGRCLSCNLTAGLPEVFARHPVINVEAVVERVDQMLNGRARCTGWNLGATKELSSELHAIPLIVELD